MITATSTGFGVLERLRAAGYRFAVVRALAEREKPTKTLIKINGPEEPDAELAERIQEHRHALKAAILLSDPPPWLEELFKRWYSGTETEVARTGPNGRAQNYLVSVTVREIASATAAEIGMDPLGWPAIREEVEEALQRW